MNQKGAADWLLGGRCDSQPLFSLWILSVHLNSGLSEHRVSLSFLTLGLRHTAQRLVGSKFVWNRSCWSQRRCCIKSLSLIALLFTSSAAVAHSFHETWRRVCRHLYLLSERWRTLGFKVKVVLPLQSLKCAAFILKASTVCFCFAGVCEYLQTCLCVLCKLLIITASDCC